MPEFRTGSLGDLLEVVTWIRSPEDCRLWSGDRLSFPVDIKSVETDIGFATARPWSLIGDGTLLGFGQIHPKPLARLHLAQLIVNPGHRGRGLGKVLVAHLLQLAMKSQPASVSLNVESSNTVALSIYRGLGFLPSERPVDEPASESIYMARHADSGLRIIDNTTPETF